MLLWQLHETVMTNCETDPSGNPVHIGGAIAKEIAVGIEQFATQEMGLDEFDIIIQVYDGNNAPKAADLGPEAKEYFGMAIIRAGAKVIYANVDAEAIVISLPKGRQGMIPGPGQAGETAHKIALSDPRSFDMAARQAIDTIKSELTA